MSLPQFVQARKTTLYTPVSSTETSEIVLSELVDIYGNELSMSDFGTTMYLTINPGGDSEEIISVTGFTRNSDDTVTLDTGITRALKAVSDYTAGGTASAHSSGTTVVVSNNPQLYNAILAVMVNNFGNETIAGVKTFSSVPKTSGGDPVADNDLARKNYVDGVVAGAFTTARVVVGATAGATIADGQAVYFDTTDDEWKLASAATAATCQGVLLGIAQGAGTDGNAIANGVLIVGVDDAQTGLTGGDIMYLSDTPGAISATPGTVEVTIGLAKMESTTELYFTPNFQHFLTEDQQDALENPTSGTALSASNGVVDDNDTTGTGSVVRQSVTSAIEKFGGDGSDGALTVTTGTTNLDASGAKVLIKNYTSISITGDGKIAVTNPHTEGTILILRSQGDVTLTSSAAPMIDLTGLVTAGTGGSGGTGRDDGGSAGGNGNDGDYILDALTHYGAGGGVGASNVGGTGGTGGVALTKDQGIYRLYSATIADITMNRNQYVIPGTSGGGGAGGHTADVANQASPGGAGGAGGAGGGALIIECGGAWNFTTTGGISVAGSAGSAGTDGADETGSGSNEGAAGGAGGGGGGAGGSALILYNTLTANTGTVISTGGNGGAGGDGGDETGGASGGLGGSGGGGGAGGGHYSGAGGDGGDGGAGHTTSYNGSAGSNSTTATGGAGGSKGSVGAYEGAGGGGGGAGADGWSLVTKNVWFS